MSSDPSPSTMDRLVEALAGVLDALGLNGTRLRWKWNQRKIRLGESGLRGEMWIRSTRGRHKMCPACRALVDRGATRCPECGADLGAVRGPGVGRSLGNLLPGTGSATSLLLLVNGAFFLLMILTQMRGSGSVGLFGFEGRTLIQFGANIPFLVAHNEEWWRTSTSLFLHGGLIHFAFNTMVLLQLGPQVEELYGTARCWVVYLVSGIGGNLLSLVFQAATGRWSGPIVGASGALCGLVGLLIAFGIRRGGAMGAGIRQAMTRYAVFILVISFLPGVSLTSHLGGFLFGLAVGLALHPGRVSTGPAARWWQALALAGIVLVLYSFYEVTNHGGDYLRQLGL